MKVCTKCQIEFPDNMAFCPYCGTPLQPKVQEQVCPACGKTIYEDSILFCPYCGKKFGSIEPDKPSIVSYTNKKEEALLSDILTGILTSAQQASASNSVWQYFGYDGFPDYNSKLKILFDINNVNNKSFLLREMVRMGVGIGLNKIVNNNIITSAQVGKSIQFTMYLISNNEPLLRMLNFDKFTGKDNFKIFVSDYANAIFMDTSNITSTGMMGAFLHSLGPDETYAKLFAKHAGLEKADSAKLRQGVFKLISLYSSSHDESCKKVLDGFDVIDDL